jgi:site-specific DNA-methyltransferase (adenine-specific)
MASLLTTRAIVNARSFFRGVVAFNRGMRFHKGYARHQCEYVVWGTRGACAAAEHAGPFAGCYSVPVLKSDKFHLTGKPTALMRQLVQMTPPAGKILDPFAGPGTTLVAALEEGRYSVGSSANSITARSQTADRRARRTTLWVKQFPPLLRF